MRFNIPKSFSFLFTTYIFSCLLLTGLYVEFAVKGVDEEVDGCKSQLRNMTNVLRYKGLEVLAKNSYLLTESLKKQIDALVGCDNLYKNIQPTVVIGTNRGSYYTSGCNIIHLNDDHSSLLVHEYVHFLDYKLFDFNLNCSLSLFPDLEYGPGTLWGDRQGYPYCYNKNPLPNHKEFMAVMAEGYCTDECGPSRSYLTNESNPIASKQLSCLKEFVN